MMTTPRPLDADRRTARTGTGPWTPEGKDRSRGDASAHGRGGTVVVPRPGTGRVARPAAAARHAPDSPTRPDPRSADPFTTDDRARDSLRNRYQRRAERTPDRRVENPECQSKPLGVCAIS